MSKSQGALENFLRGKVKYYSEREEPSLDPEKNAEFEKIEDAPKMKLAPQQGDMTSGLSDFIERMKKKKRGDVAGRSNPEDILPGLPND